ncbi:MAG TPA: pitrilysin family protein, partial [Caulobacteraceae bacterium]|nr:pitrilysin family protein [Caulobacteraceae bacterium]
MKSLPLAVALAFACGAAVVGKAEAAQATPVAVQPPPIDYHLRVLPNGLKVYSLVDRSTTNVAVQVWYGVGAKNDPPGRSGMAHLCEHLMFKGSRDMPPEFIDRLTDDVGGENDASTDDDDTEYDETAPANYLERLLWAEAERMASLDVAAADFAAERKVVEQELRQDVIADPYRALFEIEVPRASFTHALYKQSVIGKLDDLEKATPAELRAFHALYYRPDNASLVVVGDFDQRQLDGWVDRYFGAIVRPKTAIPRAGDEEPVRTAHRIVDSYAPDAPLPALVLTYAGPPAASRDAAALNVLDAVLTHGKTSRLNIDLAARRGIANHVFSEVDLWQHAGLIEVGVTLEDGVSMARGEAALRAELARVRAGGVTEAELRAAKNQLTANLLRDRETIDGVANAIGEASILQGDASHANTDAQALGAVTAQDVRRVAATYLVDARRVTIRYHAAASPRLGAPARPAAGATTASLVRPAEASAHDATVAAPEPTDGPAAIPSAPPDAGPAVARLVPTVRQRTLPNGLRVIVARTGRQPVAT